MKEGGSPLGRIEGSYLMVRLGGGGGEGMYAEEWQRDGRKRNCCSKMKKGRGLEEEK